MKTKLFLLLSVLAIFAFTMVSPGSATVITFDDISSVGFSNSVPYPLLYPAITDGYEGLNWGNLNIVNAPLFAKEFGTNGEYYGMATASNVAFNGGGGLAEIDAIATNFNFLSAYLTGAWNSNLNIEVQGFLGGSMVYDTTVVASATSPTLFTFDYMDIDRLTFNSFGGQNAGFPPPRSGGEEFAMDNLTFEFVPEPSPLLLTAGAALLLWPILKRRRVGA